MNLYDSDSSSESSSDVSFSSDDDYGDDGITVVTVNGKRINTGTYFFDAEGSKTEKITMTPLYTVPSKNQDQIARLH